MFKQNTLSTMPIMIDKMGEDCLRFNPLKDKSRDPWASSCVRCNFTDLNPTYLARLGSRGPVLCDSVSNFSNLQAVFKTATYERPSAQQRLRCTPFRLIFCPHKTLNSWRKQLLVFPSTANQIMEYDISIIMTKVWIRKRTFQVHHSFPRTWSTSVTGILDLLWERSFVGRTHM